ncbi:MAG: ankyrin repeat domain-containing protein [Planctomycetota bacterium]
MSIPRHAHAAFADAIECGDLKRASECLSEFPQLVNHPDWTPPPLHCAVLWNQPEIAELLLDSGADLEMQDPDRKTTPLRYAVMYCKTEMIPLLLARGAWAGAIVDGGTTALELAREAAGGAYEAFEDLPDRAAYSDIVKLMENLADRSE